VPEQNASSSTMFKKFKPHEAPSCMDMPSGCTLTPAVQSIVVDREPIVDPQFASIVRK
jgi:hypothetical protein